MRGYLHPPTTGQYTFWTASDNSSELWLSQDADPSKARKIARIARYEWTPPREWSKFPWQRSEVIELNGGQSYYIEALREQTSGGDNLAVAWQGPGIPQSVITAAHLTPWGQDNAKTFSTTNGIFHEDWTNFSAGDLQGLGGVRPFEFALSVEKLYVSNRGPGPFPKPLPISFDPQWLATNNYRWVEAEGLVTFVGEGGDHVVLEHSDNNDQVQLRAVRGSAALSRLAPNTTIRVEGVCEGMFDGRGTLVPGLIWVAPENGVVIVEVGKADPSPSAAGPSSKATSNQATPAMGGFYGTRGVVTFNDRVFDKDCLFVQEGSAAVFVSLDNGMENRLRVGQLVDMGGALQPGRFLPIIRPLVVTEVGWRSMPIPLSEPIQFPIPASRDGRWTEIRGVVHSVNSNGTLSVMGPNGLVSAWLGKTASNHLSRYVDAKVRLWGVLSLSTFESPILLIPSRSFVEVDEPAPANPFDIPVSLIGELPAIDPSSVHRVRVAGEVTLSHAESFFVQDATSGIRVQALENPVVKVGQAVEVIGFPVRSGDARVLREAQTRATGEIQRIQPATLDLTEMPVRQNGSLVRVEAVFLAQRTIGNSQILELQERKRIFTATLSTDQGTLTPLTPGSRIAITGVCDSEGGALPTRTTSLEEASLGSINIWLRSPADVETLSGPPWWNWRRVASLIGVLLAVLTAVLLWVHLLRRRLARQIAASQQILKRLEEERSRIAANLHDSLGQVLLAIKNQAVLAIQRPSDEAAVRERLGEISVATSQALEEVRQITHGLRPYQLDRLGLTQAMRATVSRASNTSPILFASRVEDIDANFDRDSEIHVYRIVQEAINNVLKHSAATEAAVVIKNRTNSVSLSIRDNGCGFDVAAMRSSQPNDLGYGLNGIAERVRILGGNLTIDARPGEGTSLTVEIPIRNHVPTSNHTDRG